jgi:hypothetical protein
MKDLIWLCQYFLEIFQKTFLITQYADMIIIPLWLLFLSIAELVEWGITAKKEGCFSGFCVFLIVCGAFIWCKVK